MNGLPCASHGDAHEPDCRGCRSYAATLRTADEHEADAVAQSAIEHLEMLLASEDPEPSNIRAAIASVASTARRDGQVAARNEILAALRARAAEAAYSKAYNWRDRTAYNGAINFVAALIGARPVKP